MQNEQNERTVILKFSESALNAVIQGLGKLPTEVAGDLCYLIKQEALRQFAEQLEGESKDKSDK